MTPARYLSLLAALLLLGTLPAAAQTNVDYDDDDDGLIDIRNPNQLGAVGVDLNGNGARDGIDVSNWNAFYLSAFFNPMSGMGCPASGCIGYELRADIDLSSYSSWEPIGGTTAAYTGAFEGNGHTISNLTISGITADNVGLFGELGITGTISRVGIEGASITAAGTSDQEVGILVGENLGVIRMSYTTGSVTHTGSGSSHKLGGLVGHNRSDGSIIASYSTATVIGPTAGSNLNTAGGLVAYNGSAGIGESGFIHSSYATGSVTLNTDDSAVGGLVGYTQQGEIANSYAIGAVGGTGSNSDVGGLVGRAHADATFEFSYYDTVTTGQTASAQGTAKNTNELQSPTGYSGIYEDWWDVDVDGIAGDDSPWDFGTASQYPVLKVDFNNDGTATWQEFGIQRIGQVRGISAIRTRDEESLIVSWTAATHATGYKVQWKSGNENYDTADRQAIIPTGATTTYTIPNLRADAEYTVRVIATRTNFDDGAPSADVPEGFAKASGVQVTPGEGNLVVSWTAVLGATGYKVQWKSGDENYDAANRQAVIADGTTYTIANLIGGREYTVRVIATHTDANDGPASDGVTGTPGGDGPTLPDPDPDTDPVFIEVTNPQTYRQNKAIELTLPAAIDGNGTVTYSLTELPEGLRFDAETRIISGTPTAATEKVIYTVTATDEDGDTGEMSFFITVLANVAPSFGDTSVDAQSYLRKREIESLTLPQASGGDGTLTYALTPDLPTGLTFDAETRMLSGTPLEAMGETTYTLTATDGDGDAATLTFTLSVMADPMPAFGDTTIVAQGYQHQEFDPVTLPQASGGDGTLTYALTPDLPEGLTFDAETRMVSGTPLKAMAETTYTLTATDGNGDEAHLIFTLEIPDLIPTFGDTTLAAQSYLVNQQIESLALPQATGGDGTLAYILLPFLPDGLAFDHETRVLSGTLTEVTAEATYTLSAIDADGDVASLPFTLEVSLPSPDIDGDGNVNFADFLILVDKYGSRIGQDRYDPRCDLNGDGQIDFADFLIFAADFGSAG